MNMKEKAERMQVLFRELEELSKTLYRDIQKDSGKESRSWAYLQERREGHIKEVRQGIIKAYGATNALVNVDGLDKVDVKEKGGID